MIFDEREQQELEELKAQDDLSYGEQFLLGLLDTCEERIRVLEAQAEKSQPFLTSPAPPEAGTMCTATAEYLHKHPIISDMGPCGKHALMFYTRFDGDSDISHCLPGDLTCWRCKAQDQQARIDVLEAENDRYAQIESKALTDALARINRAKGLAAHGRTMYSRDRGEPNPTPAFPTHVEISLQVWQELLAALGDEK
jgi:hypothetical protein